MTDSEHTHLLLCHRCPPADLTAHVEWLAEICPDRLQGYLPADCVIAWHAGAIVASEIGWPAVCADIRKRMVIQ